MKLLVLHNDGVAIWDIKVFTSVWICKTNADREIRIRVLTLVTKY
jgi:hypothetical protein